MNRSRRALAAMRELCGEVGPEDGLDPRLDRDEPRRPKGSRKTRQLCAAVRRALDLSLVSSADPVLQVVYVSQVLPDPDASRLKVEVCSGDPDIAWPVVLEHLQEAGGWLRSEVAVAIQRRKTPELCYAWAGPEAQEGLGL